MTKCEFEGRRVRLKRDASYGQRVASYLTDEQINEGPQGVVIRSVTQAGRTYVDVDLENVPHDCRVQADEVELI